MSEMTKEQYLEQVRLQTETAVVRICRGEDPFIVVKDYPILTESLTQGLPGGPCEENRERVAKGLGLYAKRSMEMSGGLFDQCMFEVGLKPGVTAEQHWASKGLFNWIKPKKKSKQ